MKKKAKEILNNPLRHILVAILALLLSYGTGSWAIDTGRLLAYFVTIMLVFLAVMQLIGAAQKVHAK